jgi:secreted Zn-dependent insulinase-like peptidase
LTAQGKESLWDDLKLFYEKQYSAERTYIVIQSKNDITEIKAWVNETFGILPNKGLSKQNFLTNDGACPYSESLNEMIVFGAIKDQNVISFVYTFPPSNERIWNRSMQLIIDLL